MVNHNKVSNTLSPPDSKSSNLASLCLRLAKAHAEGAYAAITKKYLGDGSPIFVDHHQ